MKTSAFLLWKDSIEANSSCHLFLVRIIVREGMVSTYSVGLAKSDSTGFDPRPVVKVYLHAQLVDECFFHQRARIAQCLKYWIRPFFKSSVSPHRVITFDCCDSGSADSLCMDGSHQSLLIPDIYAFEAYRQFSKSPHGLRLFNRKSFSLLWQSLNRAVYWRGSTTGFLANGTGASTLSELRSLPRVSICLGLKDLDSFNLKIVQVVQVPNSRVERFARWLKRQRVLGPPVPEEVFGHFRYYPDIPGNSCAWGTIKKHVNGALVFRAPPGPGSSQLFYYKLMRPWIHYVPVASDFSDLIEKHQWTVRNPYDAERIAFMGSNVSRQYLRSVKKHFATAVEGYASSRYCQSLDE